MGRQIRQNQSGLSRGSRFSRDSQGYVGPSSVGSGSAGSAPAGSAPVGSAPEAPDASFSRAAGVERYHQAARHTHKRKKHIAAALLGTLAILVVAAGIAVAWYTNVLNRDLKDGVDQDLYDQLSSVPPGDPFYMLLLGVDKSQEREDSGDFGSVGHGAFRTDSIILARVDPKKVKVTLVSIPRDTKVNLGEYGEQKINAAYTFGGQALITKTVSKLCGVPITHYAEIDFDQFTSVVDTVGGIEVTLPVAVKDELAGVDLPAGTQTLNGVQALGLSRARHAYDEYGAGDYYRQANQRMVIGAIMKKVLAQGPVGMLPTISTLAKSITTDLNAQTILTLAVQMHSLQVDKDVYSGMVPTDGIYTGGIWWNVLNEGKWAEMLSRVEAGESPYANAAEDVTAGIAGSVGTYSSGEAATTTTSATNGKVCVLNATGVNGLAGRVAKHLEKMGYTTKADSTAESSATSYIYYNGGDAGKARAEEVAKALGKNLPMNENKGEFSSEFDVIVVVGTADKNINF